MNELTTVILEYAKLGVEDYCKNRRLRGLLIDLIEEMDEMGGIFDQMNFEYQEMFKQVEYQESGLDD